MTGVDQRRAAAWSPVPGGDHLTEAEIPETAWRPVVGPAEVTVTDVTINALTVTFREARVARGFFRVWGAGGLSGAPRFSKLIVNASS